MKTPNSFLATALLAGTALGREVPQNVRELYNSIRSQQSCKNELQGGFYSQENDSKSKLRHPHLNNGVVLTVPPDYGYCGDHLSDYGIMYLQGKNGELVNMDIDCDGALGDGDGSCDSSTDTQGQTTFQETVSGYGKGVDDLNAYVHSYVVLGNDGDKSGYINFKPEQYGVEPLSIVAVVCGDQMVSNKAAKLQRISADMAFSSTESGATQTVMMVLPLLVRSPILLAEPATVMP